ncbi:MAG: hypothetical protein ACYTFA_02935 [Planctomycetota bacterium]|jgi:hypothetical protein
MRRKRSISQAARHTRKTVFIIAGVYVGIGFFVAAPAALRGDPLSAFLGFLIVSGALAGAVALNALLRLGVHQSEVGEAIDDVRTSLQRLERNGPSHNTCGTGSQPAKDMGCEPVPHTAQSTAMIDLAALGNGDPSVLTAATLDRSGFPRLVTTMEEPPPTADDIGLMEDGPSTETAENHPRDLWHRFSTGETHGLETRATLTPATHPHGAGLTTRNLLRAWKVALRDGDLQTCRSVISALVDTVGPERLAPLKSLLQDLTDRTEQSLRKAFSDCLARKDYAGALQIGEQICTLWPDHGVAADFRRVKPRLQRLAGGQERPTTPDVAVIH